ncbi:MAG: hypothetical protein LBG80_20475 [Bacteroidales bacterium]|jgi:hypothetical protein|nr:hypothetical protein [Bacteroidales bacterium]
MNYKVNMTGIMLIFIGTICLGTGIFLLIKGRHIQSEEQVVKSSETNKNTQHENKTAQTLDIDNIIEMKDSLINLAISDGVLTENEKDELRIFARKNLLDEEKIISEAEDRMRNLSTKKEVEKIDHNQKNGIDFEKYVVEKFNKKYFSIKKWRGDKYVNGRYAEDTPEPDLLIEFKLGESKSVFAVECKWRQYYYKKGFEFSQKDFDKYKQYERKTNTPLYIVIGVGGTGENPDKLYLFNFHKIKYNYIKMEMLSRFEKDKTDNFFYDIKDKVLK